LQCDPPRSSLNEEQSNASRPVSRVLYGRGSSPRRDGHSSGTPVAGRLKQPTRATGPTDKAPRHFYAPRVAPIRSCSRRGLPCRWRCRPRGALLPHPFTLAVRCMPRGARSGGLLSVALSLGSPPPDIIRRRIRLEPGLSSAPSTSSGGGGRPADWLTRAYGAEPASVKQNRTGRMERATASAGTNSRVRSLKLH
jgi:hypothetical protein